MAKLSLVSAVLALVAGCGTRKNPEFCNSSTDCADPAKPFCDVNGEFGDLMNDCIAQPPMDAEPSCTPGAPLSCADDRLTSCADNGHSTTQSACALGCGSGATPVCLSFEPSHGLGPALSMAAGEPDIVIPRGSTLNTDTGVVLDSASMPVAVKTETVTQTGAPTIRVFYGRTISIDDVSVKGSLALAFVAFGSLRITGYVDARGHNDAGGPGSLALGLPCVGVATENHPNGQDFPLPGSGGGGHLTAGGNGGPTSTFGGGSGGNPSQPAEVLVGGCSGGRVTYHVGSPDEVEPGGGGGGAVQLVSATSVSIDTAGVINVGGGGGKLTGIGGGAAGSVLIESPTLTIDGPQSGITANGGAGGACGLPGIDGDFSTMPALANKCADETETSGGNGGTPLVAPTSAASCHDSAAGCGPGMHAGGGGGAAGTLHIATRTGRFELSASSIMSASTTTSSLAATTVGE